MRKIRNLLLFGLFIHSTAFANDSTGTVAAGGIQFTQTPFIKMMSEDLTISKDKVKVAYLFKNLSDKPVATTVFFPLPPYQDGEELNNIDSAEEAAEAAKRNDSLLNFSVVADGKPVVYQVKIQAISDEGKDITNILTQADIPLLPNLVDGLGAYYETEGEELKQYEKNVKQWKTKAQQLGLLDKKGKARWKKQVTFYWPQVFPAGKTISIFHEYKPVTGAFYSPISSGPKEDYVSDIEGWLGDQFNIEFSKVKNKARFENWISANVKKYARSYAPSDKFPYFFLYNVDYILTTGANWAGPIEKFTLTLQYPTDGAVAYMPFYNDASAKITNTPGQLQILLNNFTPKQDLNIVFGEISP